MFTSRSLGVLCGGICFLVSGVTSSPVASFSLEATPFKLEANKVPNPRYFHSLDTNSTEHKFLPKQVWAAPFDGCASLDFSAHVMLGNQGPFRLIIDTGSSTLAVASSACTACAASGLAPLYTPNPAHLVVATNPSCCTSTYGDGSFWNGQPYTETITIGNGTNAASASVIISTIDTSSAPSTANPTQNAFFKPPSTTLLCPKTVPTTGSDQGIMGYAFPALAHQPTQPFFSQWVTQTGGANIFAIQMCRTTGTLWHGGYNPSSFGGSIAWTSITNDIWYVVNMQDIAIKPIGATSATSIGLLPSSYSAGGNPVNTQPYTIVDSGTSTLVLSVTASNALFALLYANADFTAAFGTSFFTSGKCSQPLNGANMATLNSKLPQLVITLADSTGANPLVLTLNAVASYLLPIETSSAPNTLLYCPGISQTNALSTILGWSVMNQFVVVHDISNQLIGFASSSCSSFDATSSPGGTAVGGLSRSAAAIPTTVPGSGGVSTVLPTGGTATGSGSGSGGGSSTSVSGGTNGGFLRAGASKQHSFTIQQCAISIATILITVMAVITRA